MAEPTLDEVMTALRKADEAGNVEDAKKLAGIAKKLSTQEKEPAVDPIKMALQKSALAPVLGGAATEFGKGIGAVTELFAPETGKAIVEKSKQAQKYIEEARPLAAGIGELGSYAAPFGAVTKGVQAGRTALGLGQATGIGGRALEAGVVGAGTMGAITPTEEGRLGGAVAGGLGGALLTPAAELAIPYAKEISQFGLKALGPKVARAFGIAAKTTAEESATQLRQQAIQKAKNELLSGSTKEAGVTIDRALKTGITERQKAIQADRLLQESSAKQEIARRQQLLEQQQAAALKPITQTPDEETFASQLQGEIFATQKPLVENRATQYKSLLDSAFNSARSKQASGNFWQNSEGGQEVKKYWEDKIKGGEFTKPQEREIKGILNDIYKGAKGKQPKDINAIDSWIRVLGDKANYGLEPEGAKALNATQARELRRTLTQGVGERGEETGGIYQWEPKFGEAKGLYSEQSELLKAWETKTGRKTLAEETKPLEVPKQYFSSRAGYDDLVSQLGGDKAKAAQYARQYAQLKTQDLTTPKELNKWVNDPKNGWIDNVPGLRQQIEQKAVAGAKAQALGEQIPVLQENLKDWNKAVDVKAQKLYSDVMSSEKPGYAIEDIFLSKKLSDSENKALFTYVAKNPEARKLIPSAVRNVLAEQTPAKMVEIFDRKITPVLRNAKLMSDADIQNIRAQALKIYEADAKDYSIPKSKKTIKALNYLYGAMTGKIIGNVLSPQGEE